MFRDAVPNTKLHSSLRKQHVSVQPTAVLTPIHGLRPLRETVVQIDLTTIVAASPASHTHIALLAQESRKFASLLSHAREESSNAEPLCEICCNQQEIENTTQRSYYFAQRALFSYEPQKVRMRNSHAFYRRDTRGSRSTPFSQHFFFSFFF